MKRGALSNTEKQLIYENERRTQFTEKDEAGVRSHLRFISNHRVERFTRAQADFCLSLIKKDLLPRVLKEMLSDVVEKKYDVYCRFSPYKLGLKYQWELKKEVAFRHRNAIDPYSYYKKLGGFGPIKFTY